MTQDDNGSAPMLGSRAVAYAVIDDEGVQHSLWFLEQDAIGEAAMVGGTVVRLCQPTLTDEERVDVAMWLSECLRQCSLATDGGSEEVAERWRNRSKRAAEMLERFK